MYLKSHLNFRLYYRGGDSIEKIIPQTDDFLKIVFAQATGACKIYNNAHPL